MIVFYVCRKMRLALGCVLLLPPALHMLLCHAPAVAAATDTDTDAHHPTPLPPLDPPRHTRHDPLLGLGLLPGLPRLLSLTSQNTPLSSQLLDALSLTLMQRYPSGSFTPLPNPLQRAAALGSTPDLRDIGSFTPNDLELLQVLLDGPDGVFGRRRGSSGAEPERGDSCRDQLPSADTSCPSTLLQVSVNIVDYVFDRFLFWLTLFYFETVGENLKRD